MSEVKNAFFNVGDKVRDCLSGKPGTVTAKEIVKGYKAGGSFIDIDVYTVQSNVDGIKRSYHGTSNLLPENDKGPQ